MDLRGQWLCCRTVGESIRPIITAAGPPSVRHVCELWTWRYNSLRMRKPMGRACARQWLAHVQSNGVCMAMVHVNGAWARQSFCEAKIIEGCRSSKFQLMTLTYNAFVLRTTHQPEKPVETNNSSHVFAAETIKAKPLNKNNPVNVEA